jgi:serine phosphatase RsbU (regulator of sigma subunit)
MNKQDLNKIKIDEINSGLWKSRYEDPQAVISESSLLLSKANKAHYHKGIAYSKLNIAAANFLQSKNEIAHENLSEALDWFALNTSEPGYSKALNLKGNLYESFGDYEKALQFCLQAHKLAADINEQESLAETCSQLGMIYTRLCNFGEALEYYHEGLIIREEMNDENAVASSLNRIGMIMRLTKKYEESLEYYFKSLDIRIRNNQTTSIPWTLLGLASTYEEMQNPDEALAYYEKGLKGGDKRCTLQCMMGSGRILSLQGKKEKAGETLARELNALSLVAEAYSSLANHYESDGQIEKALENYKLFQKSRESVNSQEAQSRFRSIEISHAIEKSEQEKEIYRLRHVELKDAYDIIEEKNKDITASINYASRIQRAMLPKLNEIRGLSSNCFVLYLPKDIVSGDFYWFTKVGSKLVIAAADCTGHGVPGALMSMLGISFLEEIVIRRNILNTGEILNELRNEIQRALHQQGKSDGSKDGMDISLCIIDQKNKMLQYSGAFNNLYLIRHNELLEYRADRMPIGYFDHSDLKFTAHDIPILDGDIVYMYSDGYADQFGGSDNKKFKAAALKTLLLKINHLPPQKQKQILEDEFIRWRGSNHQIDDVLVMGLQVKASGDRHQASGGRQIL